MSIFKNDKNQEFGFTIHSTKILKENQEKQIPYSNFVNPIIPVSELTNPLKEWEENAYIVPISPENNNDYGAIFFDFTSSLKMISRGVAVQISLDGLNPITLEEFNGKLKRRNYLTINQNINQRFLYGFYENNIMRQFIPTSNSIMQVSQNLLSHTKIGKQSIGIRFFNLRKQISELINKSSSKKTKDIFNEIIKHEYPYRKDLYEKIPVPYKVTWTSTSDDFTFYSNTVGCNSTINSNNNNESNNIIDNYSSFNRHNESLSSCRLGYGAKIENKILRDKLGVWAYERKPALDLIFYLVFPDKWKHINIKNYNNVSKSKLGNIISPVKIEDINLKFPWN